MSGKKGMKHYSAEQVEQMHRLRETGMSYRAIGEVMDLNLMQIKKCFERERKRKHAIQSGYVPKPKGRQKKVLTPEDRIRELEREVELLRTFLHAAGRM